MPLNPANSVTEAEYRSTSPTLVDGQGTPLITGSRGSLSVQIVATDGVAGATVSTDGDSLVNGANGLVAQTRGVLFNGTTWDRQRTPNVFKNVSAVVITAETTIWTPAGGKKFRLMGFVLTQGVLTGAITIRDNTAGTTIMTIPQSTVGVAFASPPMGNGILSAAANNVLTAQGAVTETITGFVFGTEE